MFFKKMTSVLLGSMILFSSANTTYALKDPSISQVEATQLSQEVQRIIPLLPPERRNEARVAFETINIELTKRLGTRELVEELCRFAELTVESLRPIIGQEAADKVVEPLGKCFKNIAKNRLLKNHPEDLTKLQRIGLDFRTIVDDSADGSPIQRSFIPGMHVKMGEEEVLIGFNDFAVPVMDFLKDQLGYDISRLEENEDVKRLVKDQLETKSRRTLPCGEGFGLEPKKYGEIIDAHSTWESYVPLYGFWVLYDTKQKIKNADRAIEDNARRIQQADFTASTISNLRYYVDRYGGEISHDGVICLFALDRKMQSCMSVMEFPPSSQFNMIENVCHTIMRSDRPLEERITALHAGLNYLERVIRPNTGDLAEKLSFCFAIDRVNSYLERAENYRQGKTFEELMAMRSLRLALNRYAIEFKFMFVSQADPILGIRVSRCKIVMDNNTYIMIFLERMDAEDFEEKVDDALDKRAQNILRKYPESPFSWEEIRRTAEGLDPASYSDMVHKLRRQENAMNAEISKKKIEAQACVERSTLARINLVGDVIRFGANVVDWGIDKVKDYLQLKAAFASGGLGANFEAPHVDEGGVYRDNPFEPSRPRNEDAPNDGQNRTPPYMNLTPLGREIAKLELSPEYINEMERGFQCLVDADQISEDKRIVTQQREYWEQVQSYEQDFINALKLSVQLKRARLREVDYDGILVEEKRAVYTNGKTGTDLARFNEYTVTKIDELEEKE